MNKDDLFKGKCPRCGNTDPAKLTLDRGDVFLFMALGKSIEELPPAGQAQVLGSGVGCGKCGWHGSIEQLITAGKEVSDAGKDS